MPLEIVRGNVYRMHAEAIVSPLARAGVQHGEVAQEIYEMAGARYQSVFPDIQLQSAAQLAVTPGYNMPCRYLIHVAVPNSSGTRLENVQLTQCYINILEEVDSLKLKSVAIPLLGVESSGFTPELAFHMAVTAITHFLQTHELKVLLMPYTIVPMLSRSRTLDDLQRYIDFYETHGDPFGFWTRPSMMPSPQEEAHPSMSSQFREEEALADADWGAGPEPSVGKRTTPSGEAQRQPRPSSAGRSLPVDGGKRAAPSYQAEGRFAASVPRGRASNAAIPETLMQEGEEKLAFIKGLQSFLGNPQPTFQQKLMKAIKRSSMSEVEVYKKANLSRKHFSKIRINPFYQPRKSTVIALAFALELNLDETQDLLDSSGFTLSCANRYDLIIRYFIEHQIFDLFYLNEVLYAYNQPTI